MMVFGGQTARRPTVETPANKNANRMSLSWDAATGNYTFDGWELEQMASKRVMPDVVLLPNGKAIIVNGAEVRGLVPGWICGPKEWSAQQAGLHLDRRPLAWLLGFAQRVAKACRDILPQYNAPVWYAQEHTRHTVRSCSD